MSPKLSEDLLGREGMLGLESGEDEAEVDVDGAGREVGGEEGAEESVPNLELCVDSAGCSDDVEVEDPVSDPVGGGGGSEGGS